MSSLQCLGDGGHPRPDGLPTGSEDLPVSGTIQPCFVLSLTARRALVAAGFCEAPGQRSWSSLSGHTLAAERAPTAPTAVPPPAWLRAALPLGAFTLVSDRPGGAGSWRLLARKIPGCLGFPGCRDPPRPSAVPPAVPPLLPPSRNAVWSAPLQDAHASLLP